MKIAVIDVECGGASLFVAPSGPSLLIDTGNGDAAAPRDAGRILEAVSDAGVKQVDHLVTTHYHGDHVGRVADPAPGQQLAPPPVHGGKAYFFKVVGAATGRSA